MAWDYIAYLVFALVLSVGSLALRLWFTGYWFARGVRAANRPRRRVRRNRNRYY